MVDELSQACAILEEVRMYPQHGALHHITEQTIAEIYGTSSQGDKRPHDNHSQHWNWFKVEKDLADGYLVDTCKSAQMIDIFQFLCPILDPSCPTGDFNLALNRITVYLLLLIIG
jgi:hypothetical protein